MDQVSRPMLIALALTVALAAVWLVALRPKPAAVENAPQSPTKAVPKAKQAAAASDAANAKLQAAAKAADQGTPAAPTASATKATGTPEAAKPSTGPVDVSRGDSKQERAILRELSNNKVVVMLFWSADSADDVATRGAVRALNTHKGKVKIHVIPIGKVGQYGSITRGVKIAQSPTTVIIGRNGQSRTIVGLSEPKELSQAVGDALAKR
jgi:hypothetical protein